MALFLKQSWLYDEGDDATKAVYIAKIEELRSHAGPIAQRYFEKEEEKRQAEAAKQREESAMRKAQEEMAKRRDGNGNGGNGDGDRMDMDKA